MGIVVIVTIGGFTDRCVDDSWEDVSLGGLWGLASRVEQWSYDVAFGIVVAMATGGFTD